MTMWGLLLLAILIAFLVMRQLRKTTNNGKTSIKVYIAEGMSKEEYALHCLRSRTDPAKLAWQVSREQYLPVQNLSNVRPSRVASRREHIL